MPNKEPLTEAQIAMMLWVRPPEAKGSKQLLHTTELETDYRDWLAAECAHPSSPITRVHASDGSPRFRRQCILCGVSSGQWIKRSTIPNEQDVPTSDINLNAEYERQRHAAWAASALDHYRRQNSIGNQQYSAYLASAEWKSKRQKVFARAGGTCEGCGDKPATQVHHLSYRNIYNEFLWQLVAICNDCHLRVHLEAGDLNVAEDGTFWEEPEDVPFDVDAEL